MAGTFVATPSKALTIEHEPTGRALTQFKPEQAKTDLSKIDILAAYGAKLRDDSKLYDLAVAKLEIVVDIMDWWGRNVYANGHNPGSHSGSPRAGELKYSMTEAMETLGYSPKTQSVLSRWRKLNALAKEDTDAAVAQIVEGWKVRAGMLAPPEPKAKKELDHDIAVEAIFRAYTKLDPDQRIELKQKIMEFEKSYKDPFAFKAA